MLRVFQRIGLNTRFSRMHPFTNTWVSICFGHSEQKESQVYWGSFVSRVIVSFVNEEENRETEEEILKMI